MSRHDQSMGGRFWPTPAEPPLREDGTLDVPALCARWDAVVNDGAADGPSVFERENQL